MTKKEEKKRLHIEVLRQMITLSTSGFGLVAALAWNNTIQEFFKTYLNAWLPQGGTFFSMLIYATIVTVFAVLITYQLTMILRHLEESH